MLQLIIEILTMMPKSIRQKIQSQTKWVHILTPIAFEDQFTTKAIGEDDERTIDFIWEGSMNSIKKDLKSDIRKLNNDIKNIKDEFRKSFDKNTQEIKQMNSEFTDLKVMLKKVINNM